MFRWFAHRADLVMVFDNSSALPAIAAVKGPAGWLARHFGGTVPATPGRAEWMLVNASLLPADLATVVRSLAAGDVPPND